ncbi:MAG: hypothetical protein QXT45_01860 [Candidatus Bilamarchaeaceae archaeon]
MAVASVEKKKEEDIPRKFAEFMEWVLGKGKTSSVKMNSNTLKTYLETALEKRKAVPTPIKTTERLEQKAIEETMALAAMLESAERPKDLKLKEWIEKRV